jgi:hypothetical protein
LKLSQLRSQADRGGFVTYSVKISSSQSDVGPRLVGLIVIDGPKKEDRHMEAQSRKCGYLRAELTVLEETWIQLASAS